MMTDGKYLVTTSFKYAMKYSPERFRDEEITKQRIKKKRYRMAEENEIRDFERTNKIFHRNYNNNNNRQRVET